MREGTSIGIQVQVPIQVQMRGCGVSDCGGGCCTNIGGVRGSRYGCMRTGISTGEAGTPGGGGFIGGGGRGGGGGEGHGLMSSFINSGSWAQK
jgi:hypothetical protein